MSFPTKPITPALDYRSALETRKYISVLEAGSYLRSMRLSTSLRSVVLVKLCLHVSFLFRSIGHRSALVILIQPPLKIAERY